jgi:Uma2 family endonuclease
MSAISKTPYLSPAEYLARERASPIKHEYYQGETFAMAGASREHNLITTNMCGELRSQLKGKPCEIYSADMRVKITGTGLYTYPDIAIVCGERQFEDEHVDTLLNPLVIVEVLSESTEAYDRGAKFAQFRQIKSLRDYVLIAQDQVLIDQFYLKEGEWRLRGHTSLDDFLDLPNIGCRVALREIYDRIEFSPPAAPATPQI